MILIKIPDAVDYNGIVLVHKQAFPNFFLTRLGDRFLYLYYKSMCKCEEAITLCALEDEVVVGFSTTALKSAGFNTRLIKNNLLGFLWESLRLLFEKPMSLIHLAKNMSKTSNEVEDKGEYAELFSIGVSPSCQGKGVGCMLLKEMERLAASKGVHQISLTTDKRKNESTMAFYQKNGYKMLYEFTAYPNREMIRYIKQLGDA